MIDKQWLQIPSRSQLTDAESFWFTFIWDTSLQSLPGQFAANHSASYLMPAKVYLTGEPNYL
jgi:hypothetical protein